MAERLTREQAAIIGAFTGYAVGPFSDIHGYAEKVLGRPIWTHQFAEKEVMAELREAARADFVALAYEPDAPSTERDREAAAWLLSVMDQTPLVQDRPGWRAAGAAMGDAPLGNDWVILRAFLTALAEEPA